MAWTFYVYDLLANELRDEIRFESAKFTAGLDTAGGWDASLSIHDPKVTGSLFEQNRAVVWFDRDGTLLFGGTVHSQRASASDGQLTVGGKGIASHYERQVLVDETGMTHASGVAGEITWAAGTDLFEIVEDCFEHAHQFTGGDIGVEYDLKGPEAGGLSGRTLDEALTFKETERKPVWSVITDLAGRDPGFDFAVDHTWVGSGSDLEPQATVRFHYPSRGRLDAFTFEQGKNVELLDWSSDGEEFSTVVMAAGAGQGDDMQLVTRTNSNLITPTGVFPRLVTVASEKDLTSTTALGLYADAELRRLSTPYETLKIRIPVDGLDGGVGHNIVGDVGYVSFQAGAISIAGDYRIVGSSVTIDGADEELSLDLASRFAT